MLFTQVECACVKADHPDAKTNAAIIKRLGAKWQSTDAETKAEYAALYAKNKAKCEEARRVYAEAPMPTPAKRKISDPKAPTAGVCN